MAKQIIEELVSVLGYEYKPEGLEKFKKGMKSAIEMGAKLTAGLVAAGGAAFGLSLSTATAGDEYAKFGRQIGMSAEALQEFEFMASRQGVAASGLFTSFTFLNKSIGELRRGAGLMKTALKDSNPELLRQLEIVEGTEEAFMLVMKAIEDAPNEVERTKIALAAFGRSGAIITRIAEAGSQGIADLRQEFRDLGGGISEHGTKQSETFIDKVTNLKEFLKGLKTTIAEELMPPLIKTMQKFEDWAKANKDLIHTKIVEYVQKGVKIFNFFWGILMKILGVVKALSPAIWGLVAAWVAYHAITKAIAAFKFVQMLFALAKGAKIAAAAQWLLNVAMTANPIGIIIAGIGVLVAGFILIKKHFDVITKYWDAFVAKIMAGYDFLKGVFGGIGSFFGMGGGSMPSVVATGAAAGSTTRTNTVNNALSQRNNITINTDNPTAAGQSVDRTLRTWTDQSAINMASGVI